MKCIPDIVIIYLPDGERMLSGKGESKKNDGQGPYAFGKKHHETNIYRVYMKFKIRSLKSK
jgi:hypothetical protein